MHWASGKAMRVQELNERVDQGGENEASPCMRTADSCVGDWGLGVMLSYILPDHAPFYLLRLPSPPTPCCVLPRSLAVSALFRHLAKFLESASSVGAEGLKVTASGG